MLAFSKTAVRQRGVALVAIAFVLGLLALTLFVGSFSANATKLERDRITAQALAQAKTALLAYAAAVDLSGTTNCGSNCRRPGDMLCPDMDNDGDAESSCGNASGSSGQSNRLGRLPWKTLELPDLRDGSGERLWYAVSNNFKNNIRNYPTNSDTRGTITLRDRNGQIIYDGSGPTGVVALIIAPGRALQRPDRAGPQDRSCSSAAICNDPANYLDIKATEDNADFTDGSADGFIEGPVLDANGNPIVNDQMLAITTDDMMAAIEPRVVNEVRACLKAYAQDAGYGYGRYPWAARLNPLSAPSYNDVAGARFGRIPDTPFTQTSAAMQDPNSASMTQPNAAQWPTANCNISSSQRWWSVNQWRELIFYAVAAEYQPASTRPLACGNCLTVNQPQALAGYQIVVISAGKTLAGKARGSAGEKGTVSNYLEGGNVDGSDPYERRNRSAIYNDTTGFHP